MSKKSGSPDFNRHQSFTAAIGAKSKNLSSMKLPLRSGTAFELQVEADEDALLLAIPKGPLQGRQVVINQNVHQSRENKMIQLRKHYVQSVKQFFDASPARRIPADNSNVGDSLQYFTQKSSQNVNKSQLLRPQSAANKLSENNVKALKSFLQNREATLANQYTRVETSNEDRLMYASPINSKDNNHFASMSLQQIQFPQQSIHQPEDDNSQLHPWSLMQSHVVAKDKKEHLRQNKMMTQIKRKNQLYNSGLQLHAQGQAYLRHSNNQSKVMSTSNSMKDLSYSPNVMQQQQLIFAAPTLDIEGNETLQPLNDRENIQQYQNYYQGFMVNNSQNGGFLSEKQNLNHGKVIKHENYSQQEELQSRQVYGNQIQPLQNDDFERDETSKMDNKNQPTLDFYNIQNGNIQQISTQHSGDFNEFSGFLLHSSSPLVHGNSFARQYSEASLINAKQNFYQHNKPSRIPKVPTKQNQDQTKQLPHIQQMEEEINFEIDPHIIMMNRLGPLQFGPPGEMLNEDDEIQTSSPQYQYDGQRDEFKNYQQENNNLIYQSTTAAVAVVEPQQEIQRKNSNYQDQRAYQVRDQRDTMQQQQQYSTINSAGNDPSLHGGGAPIGNNFSQQQQPSSSNNKPLSQMNQLNNRILVNPVSGQPSSTIIKPPLTYAQNINIPPISTSATAATQQVGVYTNHRNTGNNSPQQLMIQNGVSAVGSYTNGGAQPNINMAAGGARGDNRFSGGGGIGGVITNQNSLPNSYGHPRGGGLSLGNGVNQFQQSYPPTSLTPQAYNQQQNMMGGQSSFSSSTNLPLLKDASQNQNARVRSLNQRIEYHLDGTKSANQQTLLNINTSQYKGHQEAQQRQTQFINNQGGAQMGQPGQPQYYQQPLLRQIPNQQQQIPPSQNGVPAQFQNSSQRPLNPQLSGPNGPIGQNNGGFYYPKKMKQLRRRIPDLHISGSSDSLPIQQFDAQRSSQNNYQQTAQPIDQAQNQGNYSQDSRAAWVRDPL